MLLATDLCEMPQDLPSNSLPLVVLFHHEGNFGAFAFPQDVPPTGDDGFIGPGAGRDDQGDLTIGIRRFGGTSQLSFSRFLDKPEEPCIDRFSFELAECSCEAFPIVGAHVTNGHRRAVPQRGGDQEITRVGHVLFVRPGSVLGYFGPAGATDMATASVYVAST